jgi:hypothetical protein
MLEEISIPFLRKYGYSKFCQNVDNHPPDYMVSIIQETTIQSFSAVETSNLMNSSICQRVSDNKMHYQRTTPKFIFILLVSFLMYYNTANIPLQKNLHCSLNFCCLWWLLTLSIKFCGGEKLLDFPVFFSHLLSVLSLFHSFFLPPSLSS